MTTSRMPSLLVGRWAQSRRCTGIYAGATPIRLGVTRPQRSNDPVRLPPWPPSKAALGGAPLLTTNHPSDVLCLLPRRIKRVRVSIASPFAQLSQNGRRAGIRIDTFEMLLRLYSRYGPSDRSATQGDLCHEASSRLITSSWLVRACRSRASKYTPIVVPVILIPGLIALKLNRPL